MNKELPTGGLSGERAREATNCGGRCGYYPDIPPMSSVDICAAVLGCSPRKVRQMVADGILGHVKIGRLVRVPRHILLAYISSIEPSQVD